MRLSVIGDHVTSSRRTWGIRGIATSSGRAIALL